MAVAYHKGRFPPGDADMDWPALLPLIGPANAAVARFEGVLHGMLHELRPGSGRRPAVLTFPGLLNICEGRDAF